MKLLILLLMQVLIFMPMTGRAAEGHLALHIAKQDKNNVTEAQKNAVMKTYGKLPLYFIENNGQVDKAVKFYERGAGHATFFTEKGIVIGLNKSKGKAQKTSRYDDIKDLKATQDRKTTTEALTLSFIGANKGAKITAGDKKTGHVNYFIGNDKTKWHSNIPTYGAVTYENVYKNIDIKFYGKSRQLEHDIIVRPGGDISEVKFVYRGINDLKVTEDGNLEASLDSSKIIGKRPIIYQGIKGTRVPVEGSYRIIKAKDGVFEYGFNVASYDHTKKIVIDPVLVYSTYLGGTSDESPWGGIAVDSSGAAYVTGYTHSHDFPVVNPLQGTFAGGWSDAFVTKINPAGNAIVYSTYLGGSDNDDAAMGIAVDNAGAAYITGYTFSTDFPILFSIMGDSAFSDAFVTKINPVGSELVYSTYLGGNNDDAGRGIAVNAAGDAFITGGTYSTNFPTTETIFLNGLQDAFMTRLNFIPIAGLSYVSSTLIGGSGSEYGYGIAVNSKDEAYITGTTDSTDFPLQDPVQATFGGKTDAFVAGLYRIGMITNPISFSTYLGGSDFDDGYGVAVDASDNVYVTGRTASTDFPVLNALQPANAGIWDAFVTKITAPFPNVISYSTYLGGSSTDEGHAIAVDAPGNAAVTGSTHSPNFPLVAPIQTSHGGGGDDAFLTQIDPAGSTITASTYLGGNDKDIGRGVAISPSTGSVYLVGETWSTNFPLVNPIQGFKSGSNDLFITKISGTPPPPVPVITVDVTPDTASVPRGGVLGYSVTLTNTTASTHCFQYWENVTLPGGIIYPAKGSLYNPVPRACFKAGMSYTVHLTHGVPMLAPVGAYVFNAYDGIYPVPYRAVVDTASFNFNVTAFGPLTNRPETSWRLIEKGFRN